MPHETFELSEERITINFSEHLCQKAFQRFWNVPVGTIVSIERYLKRRIPLAEFGIDTLSARRAIPTGLSKCFILVRKLELSSTQFMERLAISSMSQQREIVIFSARRESKKLPREKTAERSGSVGAPNQLLHLTPR